MDINTQTHTHTHTNTQVQVHCLHLRHTVLQSLDNSYELIEMGAFKKRFNPENKSETFSTYKGLNKILVSMPSCIYFGSMDFMQ